MADFIKYMKIISKSEDTLLNVFMEATQMKSKTKAKSVFTKHQIWIKGKVVSNHSQTCPVGTELEWKKDTKKKKILKEDVKIVYPEPVIFENEEYIVFNKTTGLPSTHKDKNRKTVLSELIRIKRNYHLDHEGYFVVNGLGKHLSGVLLICKSQELRDELEGLEKKYRYYAVISDKLEEKVFTLNETVGLDPSDKKREKKTVTAECEVIKTGKRTSLLKITSEHYYRDDLILALSQSGRPVVGDSKFEGDVSEKYPMLHLFSLQINFDGQWEDFKTPVPRHFLLRIKRN